MKDALGNEIQVGDVCVGGDTSGYRGATSRLKRYEVTKLGDKQVCLKPEGSTCAWGGGRLYPQNLVSVSALARQRDELESSIKSLQEDSDMLTALEFQGVDNWEGYSEALRYLEGIHSE